MSSRCAIFIHIVCLFIPTGLVNGDRTAVGPSSTPSDLWPSTTTTDDPVTVYKIRHSTEYFCDPERHVMDYWLIVCPAPSEGDPDVDVLYGEPIGPREHDGVYCMSFCSFLGTTMASNIEELWEEPVRRRTSGNVRISIGPEWGRYCADNHGENGTLICPAFDYDEEESPSTNEFGTHMADIVLGDDEICAVFCHPHAATSADDAMDGLVRLVGGDTPLEGRVVIFHSGEWGSVCDHRWTEANTQIVCRELGYSHGHRAAGSKYGPVHGPVYGPIWLDEVNCSGYELHLHACPAAAWGQHDCSHGEDVAVSCDGQSILRNLDVGQSGFEKDGL